MSTSTFNAPVIDIELPEAFYPFINRETPSICSMAADTAIILDAKYGYWLSDTNGVQDWSGSESIDYLF